MENNSQHDMKPDKTMSDANTYQDQPYYEFARPEQTPPSVPPQNAHPPYSQPLAPFTPSQPGTAPAPVPSFPQHQQTPTPASWSPPQGPPFPAATPSYAYAQAGTSTPVPAHDGNWQPPRRSRNKMLYGVIASVLALLAILAGCYAVFFSGWFSPKPTGTSAPNPFHAAKCPFKVGEGMVDGQTVKCGFLTVPEDRSQPKGATIQLAVATFKASQPVRSTIPMLYLTGGPGGGALGDLGGYITSQNLSDITLGRDFIVLDQRGTGYSKPALNCHEFDDLTTSTLDQNLSREKSNQLYIQAGQACHDRLVKSGIHLSGYTTIQNATDVHDLIHALGYEKVDLYGVSYGTRLAQTVMRLFPGDLHSVILDSTVPTSENLFTSFPVVMQHAYDTLFKGCASSTTCNAEYPKLDATFYKLVNDLNANPATFQDPKYGPILLSGDNFASWLFSALYVTNFIPALPEIITQVSKGDYTLLAQVYSILMIRNDISYGMYYSVECGEDIAFASQQSLQDAANVMRPEVKPSMVASLQDDYTICQSWGQKPVPPEQKQPVTSSLPTLVLSGEYDPITPALVAHDVTKTLSKSYFISFPATGHGVFLTGTCPNSIMAAFMDDPSHSPGNTCAANLPEPAFQ